MVNIKMAFHSLSKLLSRFNTSSTLPSSHLLTSTPIFCVLDKVKNVKVRGRLENNAPVSETLQPCQLCSDRGLPILLERQRTLRLRIVVNSEHGHRRSTYGFQEKSLEGV